MPKFKEWLKLKRIINESKYLQIVFIQNAGDFEDFSGGGGRGIEGFFNSSDDEKIKFLSQWDDGGNGYQTRDKPGHGTSDKVVNDPKTGYVLSYNSSMGYAGLERIEK